MCRIDFDFNSKIQFTDEFSRHLFQELSDSKAEPTEPFNDVSQKPKNLAESENLNQLIAKADTLKDLLAIADRPDTNRFHALKIVSTLAEWSSAGKVKPSEFENNSRFIRVCSFLTAGATEKRTVIENRASVKSKEFEMILNVAGEDESAKLIQTLQLSQMVKVLSALAQKRARSTPLLRNIAYSISSSTHKLNLKECSDIFYALTILNFHDAMLMTRVSMDIIANLENNDNSKAAPVGSIVKSVGFLKFKDTGTLCDSISNDMSFLISFSNLTFLWFRIAQHFD